MFPNREKGTNASDLMLVRLCIKCVPRRGLLQTILGSIAKGKWRLRNNILIKQVKIGILALCQWEADNSSF
jgi:hypothetical protein